MFKTFENDILERMSFLMKEIWMRIADSKSIQKKQFRQELMAIDNSNKMEAIVSLL